MTVPNTTVVGNDTNWTPPPYTRHVTETVERLRAAGIEPTLIDLPTGGTAHLDEPLFTTFYGVPVRWAPGAERVHVLVDVGWEWRPAEVKTGEETA